MLQAIREKAQGWIAYAIVGMITIPFALWGINQYFGGGGELNAISINGRDISQREFRQAYNDQRRALQQMMGDKYRPELIDEAQVREQVVNRLIENELLMSAAKKRGFRVGDAQVAQIIQSQSTFQRDGHFDPALFQQYLRTQGETTDSFGYRLKTILVRNQFRSGISDSEFVTQKALDYLSTLRTEKREAAYLVVPTARFNSVVPSDSDIKAYYEKNKTSFVTKERLRVAYIELKLEDIAATMKPDEASLKQRYEEQKSRFGTPEDRRVAHILITVDDKTTDKQAKAKAEALRKRILNGERFEDVAKRESQDPGSAAKGGDLGFIGHGIMDPAFEKAAYGLGLSDVSEPVRTAFGYHLLKILDVKPGSVKPFAAVRDQLKKEVQREMAESRFFDDAEQLANATYENPDTLSVAAERLHLKVNESGWFDRGGGDGIAGNPRVVTAAFSDDVLNGGNNSEPLELSSTHYVVLRVLEHKPSKQQTLDEVRTEVTKALVASMARQHAEAKGRELARQVRDGTALATVADAEHLELKTPKPMARNGGDIAPELRRLVFRMAVPEDGKTSVGGLPLQNGDYAVVVLKGIVHDTPAKKPAGTEEALRSSVVKARGDSEVNAVIKSMRAQAKITVNRENF